jgi:rhamnose utilization protein RhaD (predicted bifunctional aldolase and dehydrogenase)
MMVKGSVWEIMMVKGSVWELQSRRIRVLDTRRGEWKCP